MLEVEEKTQALQTSMEAVRNAAASLTAFQGAVDNLGAHHEHDDDATVAVLISRTPAEPECVAHNALELHPERQASNISPPGSFTHDHRT